MAVSKKIQGTNKTGWCMTNYHENCPFKISDRECGCSCHKEKKKK
jgi:hypothetical protein